MFSSAEFRGYEVDSNIEAGHGRADIILYHKSDDQKHVIILEFNEMTDDESLSGIIDDADLMALASKTLGQLEGKHSLARLKDKSQRAYLFSVVVVKTFIAVECKEMSLSSSTE